MPKYTPAEFARLIGKPNATVTMAVKRQHLLKKEGVIDTEEAQNRAWLEAFVKKNNLEWAADGTLVAKGAAPAPVAEKKAVKTERRSVPALAGIGGEEQDEEELIGRVRPEMMDATEDELRDMGINQLRELDLVWSILKRREDTELARIKKEKQQGMLLPAEEVKYLFTRNNKSQVAAFENGLNNMLNDMIQRYKLSAADAARYKGMVIDVINKASEDAAAATKRELANMIAELSEVRARGEKK